MPKKKISVAVDLYDRHLPLFSGAVTPANGWDFEFLEVGMVPPRRHGTDRHKRMLVDREFDAAEVSLASYLVARDQGMTDIIGLPIFPRRLFSQNHIFVSDRSGITAPSDLVGRRVVIWAFQVTMSVLAKGDLRRDYGVDWRNIRWLTQHPEEIGKEYGPGVSIEPLPKGFDVEAALRSGEVDAYITPHPPEAIITPGKGISRLFPNWFETTRLYFQKHGYFPIMHLIAVKAEILERHPGLTGELRRMFDEAKSIARSLYVDPNFSMIMHARNTLEYETASYGADVWRSGLDEVNQRNVHDFIGYCVDQGLISKAPRLDDVFFTQTAPILAD
jgi:4,5-dihydroxyphthalate decarboxylase